MSPSVEDTRVLSYLHERVEREAQFVGLAGFFVLVAMVVMMLPMPAAAATNAAVWIWLVAVLLRAEAFLIELGLVRIIRDVRWQLASGSSARQWMVLALLASGGITSMMVARLAMYCVDADAPTAWALLRDLGLMAIQGAIVVRYKVIALTRLQAMTTQDAIAA